MSVIQLPTLQTNPRGQVYDSPIKGKCMNCTYFGTYEPLTSSSRLAALCHGGVYNDKMYEPCEVRGACHAETERRRDEANGKDREADPDEDLYRSMFKPRVFHVPDLEALPLVRAEEPESLIGKASAEKDDEEEDEEEELEEDEEQEEDEDGEAEEEDEEEDEEASAGSGESAGVPKRRFRGPKGRFPRAVMPDGDAPRGMRTPYASRAPSYAEIAPTFLPKEREGTWSRLFKNIAQGILAAVGFTLWNYCRTIDLFG